MLQRCVVMAGVVSFLGMVSIAGATPDKCQKSISKEVLKLESKIVKGIVKGADAKQKADAKGDPLSDVTAKVNATLGKVIDVGNPKSAISKTLAKLASIGPSDKGTCSDAELYAQGYLPEGTFGDRWRKLAVIAAWSTAWQNAALGNATLALDYQELSEAGGCPLCDLVASPPCATATCTLAGTSGSSANGIPFPITGALATGACNVPSIMAPGEFASIAGPQRSLDVLTVLPGVFACVETFTTMGVINCTGTMPTVDTDICTDHIVEDLGGGLFADECATGSGTQQFCGDPEPDTAHTLPAGALNGGPCITLTAGAPAPGEAFLIATNRIQVIIGAETGSDGLPCTADDTPAVVTPPATIPQTTGTASARVVDPDAVDSDPDATAGPVAGVPFDCSVITSADLSGGSTVSSFSALHALLGADSLVETNLDCL